MTFHTNPPIPRLVAPGGPVSRAIAQGRGEVPFPVLYALHVEGGCCAPAIPDQSFIYCDTRRAPMMGDHVVLHFTPEAAEKIGCEAWVKRLVMMQRPPVAGVVPKFASNIAPCIVVEQTNPGRIYTVQWSAIRAIHWCGGVVPSSMELVEHAAAAARRAARSVILDQTVEACA